MRQHMCILRGISSIADWTLTGCRGAHVALLDAGLQERALLLQGILLLPDGLQPVASAGLDLQAVPALAKEPRHCAGFHSARGVWRFVTAIATAPYTFLAKY